MEREPWMLVQEGSKLYLLARNQQDFVFITVNKALTAEKEEQLQRSGSFSKLRLQEMGLTFRELPRNQIRGIALSGWDAGDMLFFYPVSGKKQKYVFSDDYEKERIDAFFSGVERFTAPTANKNKKKKKAQDWRKDRQDPAIYGKLVWVAPALAVLSFIFGFAYRMREGWLLYLLSVVWVIIAVVLDIAFPAYFTLIPPAKGEKKKKAWNLIAPLIIHGWLMVIGPGSNWLDGRVFWISWLVCGILAAAVMGIFAEEFRREKAYLIYVFLIAGLFGNIETGHINEALDFSQPQVYTLEVEDLNHTSGKNSSYHCVVTLPDGREADLEIKANFYNTLDLGDPVRVEVSRGLLGIEYANAYPADQVTD